MPLRPNDRKQGQGGFTLLEVLVALAIGTVVLAAVYAAFFAAQTAADETGRTARMVFQSRMNLDRMVRELESLRFIASDDATEIRVEDITSFGAPTTRMAFATLAYPGGLRDLRYRVKDGQLEVRIEDPLARLAETYQEPPWFTLLDEVREFLVEIRSNGRWIRSWNSDLNPMAPELFRLTLAYGDEKNPHRVTSLAIPRIGRRP